MRFTESHRRSEDLRLQDFLQISGCFLDPLCSQQIARYCGLKTLRRPYKIRSILQSSAGGPRIPEQSIQEGRYEANGRGDEGLRHGIAPVAKNIRNIRHKKEQGQGQYIDRSNEDSEEVHGVEQILKDIIDYGFADNVEEELLEFDDQGNLVNCVKGAKEKRKDTNTSNLIQLGILGDISAKSESNYQQNPFFGMDGQSSMYSAQVDQFDDGTSYHPQSIREESSYMDYQGQQQNYPQIQFQPPSVPTNSTIQINFGGQQQQQQYAQPSPIFQSDSLMQNQQQEQQFEQYQAAPVYTQEDYKKIRRDLKEMKKLIKNTKQDLNSAIAKGLEVNELREYYRNLVASKGEIKAKKKDAKRQLKQQTQ